jgi:hypothetical protein
VCHGKKIAETAESTQNAYTQAAFAGMLVAILLLASFIVSKFVKRTRAQRRLRLPGDDVSRVIWLCTRALLIFSQMMAYVPGPSTVDKVRFV